MVHIDMVGVVAACMAMVHVQVAGCDSSGVSTQLGLWQHVLTCVMSTTDVA